MICVVNGIGKIMYRLATDDYLCDEKWSILMEIAKKLKADIRYCD